MICTEKLTVPPINGGAIQTYIDGVLPHLAAHHQLTVFCRRDPSLPDTEAHDGINFRRVDPGPSSASYAAAVADLLPGEGFDVLHVFNRPLMAPLYHQASPQSDLVLSIHNEMFAPEKISAEGGGQVVAQASKIITISRFIARGIAARFPQSRKKLVPIYSAADIDRFLPRWHPVAQAASAALRVQLGLQGRQVVLYVGRLSPKKGAHVLLAAVRHLQRTRPGLSLVIVGSKWYGSDDIDPYVQSLQAEAERLRPPAIFTGFVPPAEVHRYFWLADVFVCASQWAEPLSRTLYEAMAVGAPMVVTDRGGNAEVVLGWGNGVIPHHYDDSHSMAHAIRKLLRHPHLARTMGRRGRALAEQHYHWRRVANQIEGVYRSLPGGN